MPLTTSAFNLPNHLAPKADPTLTAGDEKHFAAIAESLEYSIADLSGRLDAARRAPGRLGQEALERDVEIRRLAARLRALRRFGLDLCLGRIISTDTSEPMYIGRLGLTDNAGRRLLIDWRSPAAAPFFGATHANPMGLASRRRYRWTRGRISDYWDEVFTADGFAGHAALEDLSAFIASLGSSRSARMQDVLGTIQADQDSVIRASSRGALVVDGGPGTGKTVVALHRSAYLLYSDPRLGHRRGGVLFVGPHRPYLAYVADVLPSLGEEGVQTCTLRDLIPEGAAAAVETDRDVALLKSSADMVKAIEPAVRFYEAPPTRGMEVETPYADIWLGVDEWAEAFDSPAPGTRTMRPAARSGRNCSPFSWTSTTAATSRTVCSAGPWHATRTWWTRSAGRGRCSPTPTSSVTSGRCRPTSVCVPRGSALTRSGSCSAGTPRPGPCPICRSWTRPGNGLATPGRPGASAGRRRPRPPKGSLWTAWSMTWSRPTTLNCW